MIDDDVTQLFPAPARRPLDELARDITAGSVRLAAATAAWLSLVAEFDEREGWAGRGVLSCAHWLAWQCGLAPGTARDHVRVARALTELPATAAAFGSGRLSYSKVRELTRVAEPATEAGLVEVAETATASQLVRVVRAWRRSDDVEAGRVAERRRFDWTWDDDGMLSLRMRMDPEDGAEFLAAIESVAERDARRDRAAATRAQGTRAHAARAQTTSNQDDSDEALSVVPRGELTARRCRAVTRLAAAAADADRRAGDPPRREVVVHVDAALLAEDAAAGRAHLEGGPALHPTQVWRMLCEATVTALVEDGAEVLAMGRRRRYATRAQRRALLARDGGCVRPGCTETRIERLHAHHLRHWLHGGRTDVSNMVLLCDVDHGLVHEEDLVMARRGGRLVVTTPDGRRVWGAADAAFTGGVVGCADLEDGRDLTALAGVHPIDSRRGRRPSTAGDTPAPGSQRRRVRALRRGVAEALGGRGAGDEALPDQQRPTGERMDLEHVVWVLLHNRDVIRRRAA